MDDEKKNDINWTEVDDINGNEYKLTNLQSDVKYLVTSRCKIGQQAWSDDSNQITFVTKKQSLVRIDVYHKGNSKFVKENGRVIGPVDADNVPFGCSSGYNTGVHDWTIKFLSHTKHSLDAAAIGITTDVNVCQKKMAWIQISKHADHSYMKYFDGRLFECSKETWKCEGVQSKVKINPGDTIKVTLDCEEWRFKVVINGRWIHDEEIARNFKYYFVMNARNNAVLEIID